jgi:transposase
MEGASDRRQSFKKGSVPRRIGRTKGGLNSKLHAVCDGAGRPLVMLLSEGQMSDFKGAALVLSALPKAKELLADKGYDADWFRETLVQRKIAPCIPSKSNRKVPIPHDAVLYRQRTRSRSCSEGSRTGGASTPDTTAAPTPTSRRSASLQPSSSGCDQ